MVGIEIIRERAGACEQELVARGLDPEILAAFTAGGTLPDEVLSAITAVIWNGAARYDARSGHLVPTRTADPKNLTVLPPER